MQVIRGARVATMTGPQGAAGHAPLALIEDGAVAWDGERIVYSGPASGAPGGESIDAGGMLLTPGFVDPHTHLIFAGERANEHARRLAGATYLEIAAAGGGIRSTVLSTRAASDQQLLEGARRRLERLVRSGVTTVEIKSGYGLSVEQELRMLRIARELGREAGCEVVPTLLALHATPPETDRQAWVAEVAEGLTPEAARLGLARGCDAFLEQGAFRSEGVRMVLEAGRRAGMVLHLHADQLSDGGGAELAASMGCASADHLEHTNATGIAAMAVAGTTAVLLPLSAWFLREKAASATRFLQAGVPVALGSNINPGSQRIESVSMLLAAGCLLANLSPAQALWACTAGGARALAMSDRGAIAPGLRADLVLFSTDDPDHLPYHAGVEHAVLVIRGGRIVHDARDAAISSF